MVRQIHETKIERIFLQFLFFTNTRALYGILKRLINDKTLPTKYKAHIIENYKDCIECHIESLT
ncbi:hypothetical protein D3Z46_08800 [Bacteroides sartorii]|uniref:Uncharacterized protein n=1 Tax=Phocaeicola sartorii TaxID=671267 RepID=A0A4S2FQZ6_9BACT|nr:hypothetical protein [Phocaeicola sartorii]NUK97718.1 type II toxin-antitoxin system YafQ family toxin [Phocaeicola sartorii]TGY71576.1 hypothetical protein E5339_06275 [Phocaeicola sartorii]